MPNRELIKAWIPPKVGDDEHIVRRLGWAVMRQWANLPAAAKTRIREQAIFTEDREPTVQLAQQIDVFIDKHAGTK